MRATTGQLPTGRCRADRRHCAFILLAAARVAFLTGIPKTVVVMVGFSFFITSFAIGVGGTGWLIQGEVFPTALRGRAAAIAACVGFVVVAGGCGIAGTGPCAAWLPVGPGDYVCAHAANVLIMTAQYAVRWMQSGC
jgi:hypothetical protein